MNGSTAGPVILKNHIFKKKISYFFVNANPFNAFIVESITQFDDYSRLMHLNEICSTMPGQLVAKKFGTSHSVNIFGFSEQRLTEYTFVRRCRKCWPTLTFDPAFGMYYCWTFFWDLFVVIFH